MVHFHIDALFGQICVQKESAQTGFYNRMKEVLDGIEIETSAKDDFQNTLQCLAFFRNSFHSSGYHSIHRTKWQSGNEPNEGEVDRTFIEGNFKIEFRHKTLITYNWKSAFLLIQSSVNVLQSIITEIYVNS
jgi:hypothetical protein